MQDPDDHLWGILRHVLCDILDFQTWKFLQRKKLQESVKAIQFFHLPLPTGFGALTMSSCNPYSFLPCMACLFQGARKPSKLPVPPEQVLAPSGSG